MTSVTKKWEENFFISEGAHFYTTSNTYNKSQPHTHDFYEIIYVIRGEFEHSYDGKNYTTLKTGDCVIVVPEASHTFFGQPSYYFKRDFLVDKSFFKKQCDNMPGLFKSIHEKYTSTVVNFSLEEISFLEKNLNELHAQNDINTKISLGSIFLYMFFSKFLAACQVSDQALPKPKLISKIIEILNMNQHITNPLQGIQKRFHYSPAYICHYFKKQTGMTITEYANEIKLKHAAFYLTNTSLSLREICDRIGYESLSYFHKLFQKKYQMTPSQYRKQLSED
jgi:AraC-like DNA-binding protein